MGSKVLQVAALTCASTGCILFIVALASSSWIVGCLQYDKLFKILDDYSSNQQDKSSFDLSSEKFHGLSICFCQGVLKFSKENGKATDLHSGLQLIPPYALFGSIGIIFAIVAAVTGVVFLILAATKNTSDFSKKNKASKFLTRAMIILVIAGLVSVVGMGTYTGGSNETAHDPLTFMTNIGLYLMSNALSNEFSAASGREKRGSPGHDTQEEKFIAAILDEIDLAYGYAFILGWVATAVMLFAAILSAIARKYFFDHPYSPIGIKL